MRLYVDEVGKKILEVEDLSFLGERDHSYGWTKRHLLHFRMHLALRKADRVVAADDTVANDLVRYYFVPREHISVKPQ